MIKKICLILIIYFSILYSCAFSTKTTNSLLDERKGFKTEIVNKQRDNNKFDTPPSKLFSIVKYPTELGDMSAYLTRPAKTGKKYPAIIWLTGGLPPGGAGKTVWTEVHKSNDQSAKSYWRHSIVSMYPSFRGSFANPGFQEGFYGEVNDVLAAFEYLSKIDYVDKYKVYLGGHSTGATLALLVAASTDKFKAIFAFGAVSDPSYYGESSRLHSSNSEKENYLRSPINFLSYIKSPTYIIEGTNDGNNDSLLEMKARNKNKKNSFISVDGANHFNVLYPTNELIAKKLSSNKPFQLDKDEVQKAFNQLN